MNHPPIYFLTALYCANEEPCIWEHMKLKESYLWLFVSVCNLDLRLLQFSKGIWVHVHNNPLDFHQQGTVKNRVYRVSLLHFFIVIACPVLFLCSVDLLPFPTYFYVSVNFYCFFVINLDTNSPCV